VEGIRAGRQTFANTVVVIVIRTRRPFLTSRPSRPLLYITLAVLTATLLLPVSPLAATLGFAPQSLLFPAVLFLILVAYIAMAEVTKRLFYTFGARSVIRE
jgi:Mg2+-importing ATPase